MLYEIMEPATFVQGQNLVAMHNLEQKIPIPSFKTNSLERKMKKPNEEEFLPREIIFEILSWLPLKSLSAFKCVCKSWCLGIEERQFINLNRRRAKSVDVYKESLSEWKFHAVNHGLLLESNRKTGKYTLRLRNPMTNIMVHLPCPNHILEVTRIIYLRGSDSFKLVNIHGKSLLRLGGCEVLNVGKESSWRNLNIPSLYNLDRKQMHRASSVCINEVYYLLRTFEVAPEIVCLDMKTESFGIVKAPRAFFSDWDNVVPISWEGTLSLSKVVEQELHVWVLEDYSEGKWAESKMVISLAFLKDVPNFSEKLVPYYFSEGWLSFRQQKDRRITYHVESGKAEIKYTPSGRQVAYTMHYTLVNPLGTQKGSRFALGP